MGETRAQQLQYFGQTQRQDVNLAWMSPQPPASSLSLVGPQRCTHWAWRRPQTTGPPVRAEAALQTQCRLAQCRLAFAVGKDDFVCEVAGAQHVVLSSRLSYGGRTVRKLLIHQAGAPCWLPVPR